MLTAVVSFLALTYTTGVPKDSEEQAPGLFRVDDLKGWLGMPGVSPCSL